MPYSATYASVSRHPVPDWFHDAKLGVFIHWGLYSVPGWAPLSGEIGELIRERGWEHFFANNPYAEWYLNSLRIPNSATREYHERTYGPDSAYDRFVPIFREASAHMDPSAWAELFARAGARYVVLTTKHHDGYTLWPTEHPNPHKVGYASERDLVGELTNAVREASMRMGLYYSGGLDWTFTQEPIEDPLDLMARIPQSAAYVAYADSHWKELIDRYRPAVLWNDIGYPVDSDLYELFGSYYNAVPEGVINDRFRQVQVPEDPEERERFRQQILEPLESSPHTKTEDRHYDFITPEYASYDEIVRQKWESCRGLGFSFGYNRQEGPEHMLSTEELVRSLVDIVSKNGNLLLNVGPKADGAIPELQTQRLRELGRWLSVNGDAIYGTRPWITAEDSTVDGLPLRYTQKGGALYVTLLRTPQQAQVQMRSLLVAEDSRIYLLGREQPLEWSMRGDRLTVSLPEPMPDAPAHALRITPQPLWASRS